MIESLRIANFRCFENLQLHGLRRVNVLVGRNASGKTALCEGVFLAAGGAPEIALRLRLWRGLAQQIQVHVDRRSYEFLWRDLFFGLDQKKAISIETVGSPANTRLLTISYGEEALFTFPSEGHEPDASIIVPIVFEWRDASGRSSRVEVKVTPNGLNLGGLREAMPTAFFANAPLAGGAAENAARFSDLSKEKRDGEVVEALREEFPFIEGLSVEVSGGLPTVYAAVSYLPEKIPVALLSGGINKLLSVLLAVASLPGGVVLVDEIENGFYYDRLESVWSALLRFCRRYDAQLIASTHSLECLRAVGPSLKGHDAEFCLVRTERRNGRCVARAFPGSRLEDALLSDVEVR